MSDLELALHWLEMTRFLERFVEAGFDSWVTLLEITEDDFEYLNVDLGSRRKLQREIAKSKQQAQGPSFAQPLYGINNPSLQQPSMYPIAYTTTYPTPYPSYPTSYPTTNPISNEVQQPNAPTKRGYRHHAKADVNAPERPYSAYVMFCNQTREELKEQNQNLSFTQLSKISGEKWRSLSAQEMNFWKQKAAVPWQKFKADSAEYKKTEQYREYERYLTEFKASQAEKNTERKGSMSQQQSPSSPKRSMNVVTGSRTGSRTSPESPFVSRRSIEVVTATVQNPVALKRFKRDNEGWASNEGKALPSRGRRSCEYCRARKIKCHGEKPKCRVCKQQGIVCEYLTPGGTRDGQRPDDEALNKLKAYEDLLLSLLPHVADEDQQAIQVTLNLTPQLETDKEPKQNTTGGTTRPGEESDDDESDVSGVGSMGSTHKVDQSNLLQDNNDDPAISFAGPTSEIHWIQRLKQELEGEKTKGLSPSAYQNPSVARGIDHRPDLEYGRKYSEDMDTAIVGHQIDPFQLPLKETADALIGSFFSTVQVSFPILNRSDFMSNFEALFNTMDPMAYPNRTFMAVLQLVFAISAVHAHLTEAEWAGDGRDHMLYFAQARILAVDTGILNDTCFLGQPQVFGLGGMYLLVTDQINRAWNITGLAIRSAQSLGLHLKNATKDISAITKRHHANVWFAVASLDSMLTVMTGRPTMINPQDCSVKIPRDSPEEDSSSGTSPGMSRETSVTGYGAQRRGSSVDNESISSRPSFLREGSLTTVAARFFMHYTDMCGLAREVVESLYRPGIRSKKWSDIKTIIEAFDRRALLWRDRLSPPFDSADISLEPETESCRIALRIVFYSTRIIINRPCLCRLDQRNVDRSVPAQENTRGFANKCIDSARAVLRLVLYKPDSTLLRSGPTWWMLLHHLKRALTVSLLELAFRAEHKPADANEILAEAKDAIEWLRWHSNSSPTARRTWVTMSRLLQLAAKKVGGDTSDVITAPDPDASSGSVGQQQQQLPRDSALEDVDSFGAYGGGGDQFSGDLTERSELDQFGFLREEGGMGSFFPTASDIVRIGQSDAADVEMHMGGYDETQFYNLEGMERGQGQ